MQAGKQLEPLMMAGPDDPLGKKILASGEPSAHECECPEPCNCDHDNE